MIIRATCLLIAALLIAPFGILWLTSVWVAAKIANAFSSNKQTIEPWKQRRHTGANL